MNNIIEIDFATDSRSIRKSAYFQYDRGLKVRLINVPENRDYQILIEMCNAGDQVINHSFLFTGEDTEIPQELLTDGRDVQIYLFIKGDNWGKTVLDIALRIIRRPSI